MQWECFKGLGIDRKKEAQEQKDKKFNKRKNKQKLTSEERHKRKVNKATRLLLNHKWIKRKSFFFSTFSLFEI